MKVILIDENEKIVGNLLIDALPPVGTTIWLSDERALPEYRRESYIVKAVHVNGSNPDGIDYKAFFSLDVAAIQEGEHGAL